MNKHLLKGFKAGDKNNISMVTPPSHGAFKMALFRKRNGLF